MKELEGMLSRQGRRSISDVPAVPSPRVNATAWWLNLPRRLGMRVESAMIRSGTASTRRDTPFNDLQRHSATSSCSSKPGDLFALRCVVGPLVGLILVPV